jgi:hypothetical protein
MTRWDTTVTAEAEACLPAENAQETEGNSSCFRRDEGEQTSECMMHRMRKTAKWDRKLGEKKCKVKKVKQNIGSGGGTHVRDHSSGPDHLKVI